MNSSALESRDHGLEITTLLIGSHKWQIDSVCANDLATGVAPSMLSRDQDLSPILGIEIKTKILDFRSRDQDRDLGHQVSRPRPGQNKLEHSSLKTMVSRSQHCILWRPHSLYKTA